MSGHQYATIGDTVYFWFGANDTSGSGGDGASAVFDVREAGAAAGAIPLMSNNATLLSHANYPAGCYEIVVDATTGNGFAINDTFSIFATLAIDSQNPTGFVGSCTLTPLAKEDKQPFLGSGTAQAGTTNSITLESGEVVATNFLNGAMVLITGGAGFGQAPRTITASIITTEVCTTTPDWTTQPTSSTKYLLIPAQQGILEVGTDNKALLSSDAHTGAVVPTITTLTNLPAATANWLTASSIATDAINKIRDGLLPETNTTLNNIPFTFKDSSGTFVTGATGIAITRSIDSAAFASVSGTTVSEVSDGMYQIDASAADMNGGIITFKIVASGGTPGAPIDKFVTIVTGTGV